MVRGQNELVRWWVVGASTPLRGLQGPPNNSSLKDVQPTTTSQVNPSPSGSAPAPHHSSLLRTTPLAAGKFLARQTCILRGVVPMLAAPMSDGSGGWVQQCVGSVLLGGGRRSADAGSSHVRQLRWIWKKQGDAWVRDAGVRNPHAHC